MTNYNWANNKVPETFFNNLYQNDQKNAKNEGPSSTQLFTKNIPSSSPIFASNTNTSPINNSNVNLGYPLQSNVFSQSNFPSLQSNFIPPQFSQQPTQVPQQPTQVPVYGANQLFANNNCISNSNNLPSSSNLFSFGQNNAFVQQQQNQQQAQNTFGFSNPPPPILNI